MTAFILLAAGVLQYVLTRSCKPVCHKPYIAEITYTPPVSRTQGEERNYRSCQTQ